MKSTKFGLGFEQNKSVKKQRLTILALLTTLASLVAILLGMVLVSSNNNRRFQANTETRKVLSFHYLELRAVACRTRFIVRQWKAALKWYSSIVDGAWTGAHEIKFVGIPQALPPLFRLWRVRRRYLLRCGGFLTDHRRPRSY